MKMMFNAIAVAILALACLVFSGCIIEHQEIPLVGREPWGNPVFSGSRESTANGWNENGVIVNITLTNGVITRVDIDVSRETFGFREMAEVFARPIIEASNSFDIPSAAIDGATGATATLRGIVMAGSQALLQIPGVEEEDLDWEWQWEWTPPPADTN